MPSFQSTAVNTTIFRGLKAVDPDSNVNGQVEFSIVRAGDSDSDSDVRDGFGVFAIELPHQGLIKVAKELDYETTRQYVVTILASVSNEPSETFDLTLKV